MRKFTFSMTLLSMLGVSATAAAEGDVIFRDDPGYQRFAQVEIGLRTGYTIPAGAIYSGSALAQTITGAVPVWLDVGVRLRQQFYVGAFVEFAPGFAGDNTFNAFGRLGMNTLVMKGSVGLMGRFHFITGRVYNPWMVLALPVPGFDPWIGFGAGVAALRAGNSDQHASVVGYEISAHLGADYRFNPHVGFGPFMTFAVGDYSSGVLPRSVGSPAAAPVENRAHEWFTIGVRGVLDI